VGTFQNPNNIGNNGFWPVNMTYPAFNGVEDVKTIEICMAGSGALASIDYFACIEPDNVPTASPTENIQTAGPTPEPACPIVYCDFSTLKVGVPLTDKAQMWALQETCMMWVSAKNTKPVGNVVNVFNTSVVTEDPDLGTPNNKCPGGGVGVGVGGEPGKPFANCEGSQGNVLIIQNESVPASKPNDSAGGGCLQFTFTQSVSLLNLGVLDIDEKSLAKITVTDSAYAYKTFNSPNNIGDNGLWIVNKTVDTSQYDDVLKLSVCLPGSGAVAFVHFEACPPH
jgi:hypothetical protein